MKSFRRWRGTTTCARPRWDSPLRAGLPPSRSTPVSSGCEQSLAVTAGSDKTSSATSAALEPAVSAPFAKQGRKPGGCLSEAGTATPCPPGSGESSKLAPHTSPSHVHPASSSAFWQEAIFFYYLFYFFWAGSAKPHWNPKERHESEIYVSFG